MSGQLQKFMNTFLAADDAECRQVPLQQPVPSLFQFRYSCTEISSQGSQAHVRHSETRYENGKLVREECEGAIDGSSYERMVEQNQKLFAEQVEQMMRLWTLPFGGWQK